MNVAKRWDARSTSHRYARQAGTLLGGADRRCCCASTPTASKFRQFFRAGGMEKGEGAARRASRGAEARVRAEGKKVDRSM